MAALPDILASDTKDAFSEALNDTLMSLFGCKKAVTFVISNCDNQIGDECVSCISNGSGEHETFFNRGITIPDKSKLVLNSRTVVVSDISGTTALMTFNQGGISILQTQIEVPTRCMHRRHSFYS